MKTEKKKNAAYNRKKNEKTKIEGNNMLKEEKLKKLSER